MSTFFPDSDRANENSESRDYDDDHHSSNSRFGEPHRSSEDDKPESITFQNLLLTTTKKPTRHQEEKFSFERLISSPDSSRSEEMIRRSDVPFPGFGEQQNENENYFGHSQLVYLPRDELVPRFEDNPPAPDLGIGFDDWLKDSGIGQSPKDFIGSSVEGLPKKRKKRSLGKDLKNFFWKNLIKLRQNLGHSERSSDLNSSQSNAVSDIYQIAEDILKKVNLKKSK